MPRRLRFRCCHPGWTEDCLPSYALASRCSGCKTSAGKRHQPSVVGTRPAGYIFRRPYAWLMERYVLPNFTFFGWLVLIVEAALGAFLLIGLATRFWALVGIAETVAIALSVLNAPNEWYWSYLLMFLVHLALFATAAGRYAGLDGVLRPKWQESGSWAARVLVRLS
jgi:uncharacterized membrane protein YphA (DoxX/SURF4 family)